ncbi:MAG: DNA-3-methyladenine glycosylase [Candidatus Limnocylindria bacterium]
MVRDDGTGRRAATIVEVEAYGGPEDRASHARSGPTRRNRAMFGPAGHTYVYRVYGMHDCLNVVTGDAGTASAVLVRAAMPVEGIEAMRLARLASAARRRVGRTREGAERAARSLERTPDARVASGPGRVASAFGLDTGWDGIDLCDAASPLRLEPSARRIGHVESGPRIGVAYAGPDWAGRPWRLWLAGHPAVSGPAGSTSAAAASVDA